MGLHPLKTTERIRHAYRRYLQTFFRLKDPELKEQFRALLQEGPRLSKGPLLEATPPFQTGPTLNELIQTGMLHLDLAKLGDFPAERPLYLHQEQAITQVIREQRNIVVATGTGSGKTECFLFPILDALLRERDAGTLGPGVRALLLYPMNALANDQLKRLRKFLAPFPEITFGRYVGETKERAQEAEEHFRNNYPDEPRLENELLSRERMREAPPHILLTNYAMLEYLLLRPKDCAFFDGEHSGHWRFLVLDEAHIYNGAMGIEMAMLLRRLKERVVRSEPDRLRCIATSATLGGGREDSVQVTRFATQLFGEQFEWDEHDVAHQDVISAERVPQTALGATWGKPHLKLYSMLAEMLRRAKARGETVDLKLLASIAETEGVPHGVVKQTQEFALEDASLAIQRFLYRLLKGDEHLRGLRTTLQDEPKTLGQSLATVFAPEEVGTQESAKQALIDLVDLAVQAKAEQDDQPLLPARYHLFVKALEGAFVSLYPEKQLFLEHKEQFEVNGKAVPVFELAACRRCGQSYLTGYLKLEGGIDKLCQSAALSKKEYNKFFLLSDQVSRGMLPDEDEEVASGEEVSSPRDKQEWFELCARCGSIWPRGSFNRRCTCEVTANSRWALLRVPMKEGRVNVCPACGNHSPGIVQRLLTGKDATASVLGSALYQQIPPTPPRASSDTTPGESDPWVISPPISAPSHDHESYSQGRKLLIFSDSRQDAAFFTSYFERTYNDILHRRLIVQIIQAHPEIKEGQWQVQDLIKPLMRRAEQLGLFTSEQSPQEREGALWTWLMRELMALDRRNSLEGLGLLGFRLIKPEDWSPPSPLLQPPWSLSKAEVWTLYQVLLDSFRRQGALTFPEQVNPEDRSFAPRNRQYFIRGDSAAYAVYSWAAPRKGTSNRRLDFLLKLQQRLGSGVGQALQAQCREVLGRHGIWKSVAESRCWDNYLRNVRHREAGIVHQLSHRIWALLSEESPWYRCDTCGMLWPYNLRGVCPTYRCLGTLHPCRPAEAFKDNHYRQLYLETKPIPMRIEEHTAQLKGEEAAEIQEKFVKGKVNVLSCSTTFELGVDVGELEAVFLRNVPPHPANYIQRAGRAGRRTGSTAFVLTFAQRRSHDLGYYQHPEEMVSGLIRPPYFELLNDKIIRRHLHAVALAEFWKAHQELFGQVQDFFIGDKESPAGPVQLREWLDDHPPSLRASLEQVIPNGFHDQLGIPNWNWVDRLFSEDRQEPGILRQAALEVQEELDTLEQAKQDAYEKGKPVDYLQRSINTIRRRNLLNFLAARNVLPRYGFPVDVVELEIHHHSDAAQKLELQRDLRIALSEYAPGSEVVAAKRLWKGYGLKRVGNLEWPKYHYAICKYCGRYQRIQAEADKIALNSCQTCHALLEPIRTFIIPRFGFVTSSQSPGKPGERRPAKTYTSHIYFAEYGQANGSDVGTTGKLELGDGQYRFDWRYARQGKLAVINSGKSGRGFRVCHSCGFAEVVDFSRKKTERKKEHQTPWGLPCKDTLYHYHLGHEFLTDVFDLRIQGTDQRDQAFWLSLLYALLEGASQVLNVTRDDLDGCLYPYTGGKPPALVLFDNVPGGAGHVKRIGPHLQEVLIAAQNKVKHCDCGLETSCNGCLRNYYNQFYHGQLKRGLALDFLERLGI